MRKKLVIDNAIILCGRELEVLRGHMIINEGIIEKISEGSYNYADKIDAKRGIILPAFTNAHLHIADSVAKDAFAYEKLEKRVGRHGVKFMFIKHNKKVKNGIKVKHAIIDSLKFMQKAGISAFCDFREGGIEGIKILKDALSEIDDGKYLNSVILGRPSENEELNFLNYCDGFGVASLSRYSFEFLREARKFALERKKLFALHFAEKEEDKENVKKLFKLKPDFVVHLTNAGEDLIKEIKRKKINIVLCVRANASFAAGIPKLKEIFSDFGKSVKIGIGTDNVMANSLNMLRECEFIFKLYRGIYKEHGFKAENILACATFLGREVLNLKSNAIEEGNIADFICFRKGKYLYDPALYILHRAEIADIKFKFNKTLKKV